MKTVLRFLFRKSHIVQSTRILEPCAPPLSYPQATNNRMKVGAIHTFILQIYYTVYIAKKEIERTIASFKVTLNIHFFHSRPASRMGFSSNLIRVV